MQNDLPKYNLTLDPDPATDSMISDSAPALASVKPAKGNNYSVGTIDESMLSAEEQAMVNKFAEEIDISNVNQTVKYGANAQRNISDFSVSILKKVKTHDMGEVGDSLRELTIALDSTVAPQKKGILGVFQKAKHGVNSIRANYAKAETNVDRIEQDLRSHEAVLVQDISIYQQMYELNVQYYRELTMYILAGKKALDTEKAGRLAELREIAEQTSKQEDVQAYRDLEDLCHRFEKKLSDLEITRVISMQSAPQIRMLQNNDRELLDKLQSSIANTIPLWRNQLVLSLGIEHTRRSLVAQNTLTDKTNALLKQNSETLRMATVETAKAAERPLVDIETLHQCNKDLISSLREVVSIHEQGSRQRTQIREELVHIEVELKQAMLETSQ